MTNIYDLLAKKSPVARKTIKSEDSLIDANVKLMNRVKSLEFANDRLKQKNEKLKSNWDEAVGYLLLFANDEKHGKFVNVILDKMKEIKVSK